MKTLVVKWQHSLPASEIKAGIEKVASTLGVEYGFTHRWTGPFCVAFEAQSGASRGVTGTIRFSGSLIEVTVRLTLLAISWEKTIREGIESHLKLTLGGERAA